MSQHEPARTPGAMRGLLAASLLVGAVAVALLLVGVRFDLRSQLIFSGALLLLALIVNHTSSERATHVLILATLLVTTRYVYWRATSTLVFDDPFSAAAGYTLFGAELYAYLVTLLGYLQMIRPLKRLPAPLPEDPLQWPTVDVFIPTYNEPLHVVSATVAGALNLEWPRVRIIVHLLDDGDRPEFRRFAAEAGINYRARQDNHGAKAGNLNSAIAVTGGELIAIFDCDHVPARSFLQATAGWFLRDDNLAQLQTPHHFYNPDPVERNLDVHGDVPNEGSLFYGLIQDGNDLWNATFFCGSCALIRRTALEEVGGIAIETVTEDAHTSLKLHKRGWNSAYINLIQAAGLATETLAAHVNQRIRWARGLSQMLRLDNPLLARGLSLAQRLCYLNAMLHFLYAVPRLVFLLAPLCFLYFDLYVIQAEAMMVAAMALPHLLHTNLTTARMHGRWRRAFWAEVYETILSFYILMPTLVALIAPSRGTFNVTEKGAITDRDYFSSDIAKPFMVIALLNLAGLGIGVYRILDPQLGDSSTTWLNMAWTVYNLIIVGVALSVACETRQTRGHFRRDIELRAWLGTAAGSRIGAHTHDLSESGVAVTPDAAVNAVFGATVATEPPWDEIDRVIIEGGDGPIALPVTLVSRDETLLRLNFAELSFQERRSLVGLLYSPADTWLDADRSGRPMGALRSLVGVVGFGLRGWVRTLGVALRPAAPRRGLEAGPGKTGRHGHATALLACIALLLGAALVDGYAQAAERLVAPDQHVYDIRMLSDRVDVPIAIDDAGLDFHVPFAVRRDSVVESLRLELAISYRDWSRADDRRLRIRVNDQVVWTASASRAEQASVSVPVPGVVLGEYNSLTFELMRSGADDQGACRVASEARFDLEIHQRSRLVLEAEQIPLANELSSLPLPFFDPRDPRIAQLAVVMPGAPDTRLLRAAGDIAGWFGRLADYRGALFDVHYDQLPTGNAVVIATADRMPDDISIPQGNAPSITLLDNPRDPASQLLLVYAPTAEQLRLATRQLSQAVTNDPRPALGVAPFGLDPGAVHAAPRWLPNGVDVPLHALATQPVENGLLDASELTPITLPFALPGDFRDSAHSRHRLRLDYRFSPDRPDVEEQLFVVLNGRTLRTIALGDTAIAKLAGRAHELLDEMLDSPATPESEPAGPSEHRGTLELTLPADSLRADNRLELRFGAGTEPADGCLTHSAHVPDPVVEASILPTSTIRLDHAGHAAALPDLALFANSGIPFTRRADLSGTEMILPPQPAEHDIAVMMATLGRLSALSGAMPNGIAFGRDAASIKRADRILIGTDRDDAALTSLLSDTPLSLSGDALSLDFSTPEVLYRAYASFTTPSRLRERLALSDGTATPDLDGVRALIAEMRTPDTSSGTTLLLQAHTAEASENLARALVDRRRISELQGGAAVVDSSSIVSLRTGSQYFTSDLPALSTLAWWLEGNLPIAVLLGTVAMLLFCFGLPALLDRIAHRRLGR